MNLTHALVKEDFYHFRAIRQKSIVLMASLILDNSIVRRRTSLRFIYTSASRTDCAYLSHTPTISCCLLFTPGVDQYLGSSLSTLVAFVEFTSQPQCFIVIEGQCTVS